MKLLIHSITGPDNPTHAIFPLAIASHAIKTGHEVNIFLAGNAVGLMRDEIIENLFGLGVDKLKDAMAVIKDKGVKIHLSTYNCKVRGITEKDIENKNGVMSGPDGLLKLTEEADKVLSY